MLKTIECVSYAIWHNHFHWKVYIFMPREKNYLPFSEMSYRLNNNLRGIRFVHNFHKINRIILLLLAYLVSRAIRGFEIRDKRNFMDLVEVFICLIIVHRTWNLIKLSRSISLIDWRVAIISNCVLGIGLIAKERGQVSLNKMWNNVKASVLYPN